MMFENKFNKYLFAFLLITGLAVISFWDDLVDFVGEGGTMIGLNNDDAGRALLDSELAFVRGVYINGENAVYIPIQVLDLSVVSRESNTVTLSFRIVNQNQGGAFPKLVVSALSKDGHKLRSVEFGPKDYRHGSVFSSEAISLTVEVKPGDASFTVVAI